MRSGLQQNAHVIQAFIASVANRLYSANVDAKFSELTQINCILSLGYVAEQMADVKGVVESVLTILQQRFCHPPSQLDTKIIEQFAALLMTGQVSVFVCSAPPQTVYHCFVKGGIVRNNLLFCGSLFVLLAGVEEIRVMPNCVPRWLICVALHQVIEWCDLHKTGILPYRAEHLQNVLF